MNWTIILQVFITSAFSSAIISSIVTSLLENQNDLRKIKIAAYIEFLEQVNKVFPIGKELVPRQECYDTNALEVSKLEKYMWRIRVLGSQDISDKVAQIHIYFYNALLSLQADDSTKANDEINNAYKALTQLTIAMAQEIQQGILRKFCKWIRGMVRFG